MTDLERARLTLLEEKYRGLEGETPPFGDVIFLLRMVATARREGAEQASGEIRALRKALHDETMKRLASAEEMRERAAQCVDPYLPTIAAKIRALPLTPEEPA